MNLYIVILLLIAHMSSVPYVSQEGEGADKFYYDCGPANVSMLIRNYTDANPDPDMLMNIIGSDRYTFSDELLGILKDYGLKAEILTFETIEDLITRADRDPVIILTYHHWITITGEYKGKIRFHDSVLGRDQFMSKEAMLNRWNLSGMRHQGIVVTKVIIPRWWGLME